ncbi:MAG: hypothetical protein JXL97_07780 [Bacteroidales bacterium]|nr:hypothetical protein [Bacteroidales bacterium]
MKNTILTFVLLVLSFISSAQENWELKKSSDGIKVYLKKSDNSNICEFKATTKINTSIENVFEIIIDADNYPDWIDQISFAKRLSKTTDNFIIYYQIKLPVGFKNRDVVLNNKVVINTEDKIKIELQSTPKSYNEQKGYVRIEEAYGFWLLTSDNGQANVTYQFYSDPKGIFPAWLINIFIVDGPFKTLQNLKNKF